LGGLGSVHVIEIQSELLSQLEKLFGALPKRVVEYDGNTQSGGRIFVFERKRHGYKACNVASEFIAT